MCHHIVRRTSNVVDPPRFTDLESLGLAPLPDKKNYFLPSYYFLIIEDSYSF